MVDISEENGKVLNDTKLVYYFSGTGNSYYVAKRIAESIGAVLEPIVSLKEGDDIEADMLCFVFPVYDFKPPQKVTEIVQNLSNVHSNYAIAIATYGVALSSTLSHFEKTLHQKGVILSRGYGIKLPHNAVGSIGFTDEENYARVLRADERICDIVSNLQERKVGVLEKTSIFEDLTILKQIPHIMRFLSILIFKGTRALEFTVTEDCIHCYRCRDICAVNNIELVNGKPAFGKHCTSCFACLQWCPESAIRIGKYSFKEVGMKHYHHPKVQAVDLILDGSREME